MGVNNEFNYRWDGVVQIRTCPYLNNVVPTRSPEGKKPREPDARIQELLQCPAGPGQRTAFLYALVRKRKGYLNGLTFP